MYINGFNYWLTKHGRLRFIQRVGKLPDSEILTTAVHGKEGYQFVWMPDKTYPTTGRRLVTVYVDPDFMMSLSPNPKE